jgi:hypothetical protein
VGVYHLSRRQEPTLPFNGPVSSRVSGSSPQQGGTAYRFGELIDKHGRENWLEPLIDELGPYIQLQLGDVANMLEVFAKSVP